MQQKNIYFIVFPQINILDLTGTLQVFSSANELMEKDKHPSPYNISVLATHAGSLETSSGLSIYVDSIQQVSKAPDTIIVVGGNGVFEAMHDTILMDWLKMQYQEIHRMVSICSGAFILAECGFLDGKKATTHWSVSDKLAECYPNIQVNHDEIFIHQDKVWTSAGVTSGIDLALALVLDDLGHYLALKIAQDLVISIKREGGQKQFSPILLLQKKSGKFSELHAWILEHLDANLSVKELAAHMNMSERSFIRHYKNEIGTSPARAVEQLRVEYAKDLIIRTNLSLKKIAQSCGFHNEIALKRNFFKYYSITPHNLRLKFNVPYH
ncbi:DJ-1/PfpI family protein [Acinetobacter sp. WU_MDCI_Axc73]|nr:DJ-1/PfpI family protein [Acinetobacter sp. WU_MDCI_Axc73]